MGEPHDKPRSIAGLRRSAAYPNPVMPKLTASAAFLTLTGMQLVGEYAGRLWEGRGIGSHPPFTAAELGLIGLLSQLWVSHAAMAQFGIPGMGLPSIPREYFEQHPGEVMQVSAQVMQFDNPQAPHTVLESPYYNRSLVVGSGGVEELSTTVHDGLSYRWPGYESDTYYQWQWAAGNFYNDVVVRGHDLPVETAIAVARSMGHDRCGDH